MQHGLLSLQHCKDSCLQRTQPCAGHAGDTKRAARPSSMRLQLCLLLPILFLACIHAGLIHGCARGCCCCSLVHVQAAVSVVRQRMPSLAAGAVLGWSSFIAISACGSQIEQVCLRSMSTKSPCLPGL